MDQWNRGATTFWMVEGQRGVTLIELMIGILVATVVVGAGFGVMVATEKSTRTSHQLVDAQQGARLAMELISRDIKQAGFGPWSSSVQVGGCAVGPNPAPIVPVDQTPAGPDSGPDGIMLVVPLTNTQNLFGGLPWQTSAPMSGSFTSVPLDPSVIVAMQQAGLGTITNAVSINGVYAATVAAVQPAGLLLASPGPPGMDLRQGVQVSVLQCVEYRVGTTAAMCGGTNPPCLLRGNVRAGGGIVNEVAVADGVEDLQFAYACDGCVVGAGATPAGVIDDQGVANNQFTEADFVSDSPWSLAPMTPETIRMVRVNIVGRQTARTPDQGFGEGNSTIVATPTPLRVEDHDHANGVFAAADGVQLTPLYTSTRRRIYTKTVQTKNLATK